VRTFFTEIKECVDGIADGLDVGCLWSGHIGDPLGEDSNRGDGALVSGGPRYFVGSPGKGVCVECLQRQHH
jgi:hypothetical protein